MTLVQFHPSYAYEDFVQGLRPKLLAGGQPGFELKEGPLLRAAERARKEPGAKHYLVIDEINRGNIAKVFGELYFLLEYRDEKMQLQYQKDGEQFSLPGNLYVIGTMNTADRSIALVDLALRRRFYFVEFHPDDEPVKSVLKNWLAAKGLTGLDWVADVVERTNEKLQNDRHAAIGPSYFMKDGLDKAAVYGYGITACCHTSRSAGSLMSRRRRNSGWMSCGARVPRLGPRETAMMATVAGNLKLQPRARA